MAVGKKKKRRRGTTRKRLSPEERRRQLRTRIIVTSGLMLLFLVVLISAVLLLSRSFEAKKSAAEAERSAKLEAEAEEAAREEEEAQTASVAEAPSPSPEPEVPELVKNRPDIDIGSWEYILANSEHSISDYTPDVAEFEGVYLDTRILDAMTRFIEDTRAQGLSVVMTSGYRSYDTQTYLFENKVAEYGDEAVAATIVARPGTSEHQTGLAADICDDYYEYMNESLENTATYQWMSAHCQDYGFIVRFPKDKEDITGIIYEPWHYRYVGVEAAKYIMEHDLTLEEFVELYE